MNLNDIETEKVEGDAIILKRGETPHHIGDILCYTDEHYVAVNTGLPLVRSGFSGDEAREDAIGYLIRRWDICAERILTAPG